MGKFNLEDIQLEQKKNILKQPEPKKPKLGRPKKAQDERLTKKITLNLTASEYQKLTAKAKTMVKDNNLIVPLPALVRVLLKKDGHI